MNRVPCIPYIYIKTVKYFPAIFVSGDILLDFMFQAVQQEGTMLCAEL